MSTFHDMANGTAETPGRESPTAGNIARSFDRRGRSANGDQSYRRPTRRSAQIGDNALASGDLSAAAGPFAFAQEDESVSIGAYAAVRGNQSTGVGFGVNVTKARGTVIGHRATITEINGTLVGYGSTGNKAGVTGVGHTITITGTNGTGVGQSVLVRGTNGTAVGQDSDSGTGDDNTVVGQGTTGGSGSNNTIIGKGGVGGSGSGCTGVGEGVSVNSLLGDSTAVGFAASLTGRRATSVGANNSSTHSNCLLLGESVVTTANGQMIAGSSAAPLLDGYFGQGVTVGSLTSADFFVFHGTNGTGTNQRGLGVKIAGGQSTGTAEGGSVRLQTSTPGSSGTAINALVDRFIVDTKGSVVLNGEQAALATNATDGFTYLPTCAGAPTGAPTAKTGAVAAVVDTTNSRLYVYIGAAWVSTLLA